MVMTREEKISLAAEVKDRFDRAVSMVLVDFGGVDVKRISELRDKFRAAEVEYKVVKNNVVRKAIAGSPLAENDAFDASLKGMTGIAWSYEDPSAAAKIVKAFRKEGPEYEKLEIKCGVMDGDVMDPAQVETVLASMPGKDEVRAMLLAQLMAPAQSLVRQLAAPSTNLVFALDARRRQQEEGA